MNEFGLLGDKEKFYRHFEVEGVSNELQNSFNIMLESN